MLWSQVEPIRGAPYNWAALAQIDAAVAEAKNLGMNPVVIVRGTPVWASVTGSGCAAIQDQYLPDFANFMAALVQRYKYDVAYWEMGNEPDVDPRLVPSNSPYGCWGNINDPYYGGERYGRMLRTVVPTMRTANPNVKIVIGGLLLDRPETTIVGRGTPERFFEGILRSSAADFFDILAYHSYPSYISPFYDHDLSDLGNIWTNLGGWTLGKAAFLREVMARYGVSKPLWLNETGLICWVDVKTQECIPPINAEFFSAQADHIVRIMARAAAANIQQVSWYTLNGPGWRSGGLLDANQNPRPSFIAYKLLIETVGSYQSVCATSDYGSAVEAYRFVKGNEFVDVLWSTSGSEVLVRLAANSYRSAVTRSGGTPPLELDLDGVHIIITVGFQAVFITRARVP
ncbi:hypothetical protein EKD04_020150 [Chloroflexales bacterium ZM16-3]|nr:hypothetical protein [Chloroflexales bacterium ZM16-3]